MTESVANVEIDNQVDELSDTRKPVYNIRLSPLETTAALQ